MNYLKFKNGDTLLFKVFPVIFKSDENFMCLVALFFALLAAVSVFAFLNGFAPAQLVRSRFNMVR